ncbi:CDP-alcohol phosphatidyltransferase family protein [Pseudomonas sp. NPDC090202]|uniref:CDP-alcohol phosphatidyltransferase family protein n=1 Tax=unclassified Pseudomonas TaxID=196821 RepID=UPI0038086E9B
MLTTLDAWLQKALHPIARTLFDDGVRAVHVTLCAGLISLAVGVLVAAFAFHRWIFALIPIWVVLRVLFLSVETLLATEFGQLSKASICAREFSRVIAVTALFLPFAVIPKVSVLLTLLVVLLAIFSEFAGLLGPLIKASRRRDGPMSSGLCLLFFAVFGAGIASGHLPTAPINILLAVMAILLLVTIGKRIRNALKETVRPVTPAPVKAMAEE